LKLSKTNVTTTELYSSGLPNITITDFTLESVNIKCLEDGIFDGSVSLKSVSLKNNKIEFLDPKLFYGLINLKSFNLAYCSFSRIPSNLLKNNNIVQVSIGANKINYLPRNLLKGQTSLGKFYFFSNRINKVPNGFFNGLTNLQLIYLNDNKLETIDFNLFQGLIKLKTLQLNGNPLTTKMNRAQLLSDIHSVCGCTITTFMF
jgi:Leucine-rich repeat (LRR) protein